jgi:hypothetical protein
LHRPHEAALRMADIPRIDSCDARLEQEPTTPIDVLLGAAQDDFGHRSSGSIDDKLIKSARECLPDHRSLLLLTCGRQCARDRI